MKMKKTIITALLALVWVTGQGQMTAELPADWKNVQYAQDETLPDARINKGVATIKVKLLGYKPEMKRSSKCLVSLHCVPIHVSKWNTPLPMTAQ